MRNDSFEANLKAYRILDTILEMERRAAMAREQIISEYLGTTEYNEEFTLEEIDGLLILKDKSGLLALFLTSQLSKEVLRRVLIEIIKERRRGR